MREKCSFQTARRLARFIVNGFSGGNRIGISNELLPQLSTRRRGNIERKLIFNSVPKPEKKPHLNASTM